MIHPNVTGTPILRALRDHLGLTGKAPRSLPFELPLGKAA